MEQYDLQYDNFTVTNESTVKKLEKQVMVTDSGIKYLFQWKLITNWLTLKFKQM